MGIVKISVEGFKFGGKICENGCLCDVLLGYKCCDIDFGCGLWYVVMIFWGDVVIVYYSIGILDIEVYLLVLLLLVLGMCLIDLLCLLFGW